MGSGFSDLLYSDNPNRRVREQELQNDLDNLKATYDAVTKNNNALLATAHTNLSTALKALGIDSLDHLGIPFLSIKCSLTSFRSTNTGYSCGGRENTMGQCDKDIE